MKTFKNMKQLIVTMITIMLFSINGFAAIINWKLVLPIDNTNTTIPMYNQTSKIYVDGIQENSYTFTKNLYDIRNIPNRFNDATKYAVKFSNHILGYAYFQSPTIDFTNNTPLDNFYNNCSSDWNMSMWIKIDNTLPTNTIFKYTPYVSPVGAPTNEISLTYNGVDKFVITYKYLNGTSQTITTNINSNIVNFTDIQGKWILISLSAKSVGYDFTINTFLNNKLILNSQISSVNPQFTKIYKGIIQLGGFDGCVDDFVFQQGYKTDFTTELFSETNKVNTNKLVSKADTFINLITNTDTIKSNLYLDLQKGIEYVNLPTLQNKYKIDSFYVFKGDSIIKVLNGTKLKLTPQTSIIHKYDKHIPFYNKYTLVWQDCEYKYISEYDYNLQYYINFYNSVFTFNYITELDGNIISNVPYTEIYTNRNQDYFYLNTINKVMRNDTTKFYNKYKTTGKYKVVAYYTDTVFGNLARITSDTVNFNIFEKQTPVITWNSVNYTYGGGFPKPTCNVSGTFVYNADTTNLKVGKYIIKTTFTPTNTFTQNITSKTITINILPITPIVNVNNITVIKFNNVADSIKTSNNVSGVFTYNPLLNSNFNIGINLVTATFTPTNSNYAVVNKVFTITVLQATPIISINNISVTESVVSNNLLIKKTSVIGSFTYNPTLESLKGKVGETVITATFTPNDNNYKIVTTTFKVIGTKIDLISFKITGGIITDFDNTLQVNVNNVNPSNFDINKYVITYNITDKTIATISNTGLITPLKNGTTTISVTINGITKTVTLEVNVKGTGTGIDDNLNLNITVYPNPVVNELHVSGIDFNTNVIIFNTNGQVVLNQIVNDGESINVSNFNKGMYIVKIDDKTFKIIK